MNFSPFPALKYQETDTTAVLVDEEGYTFATMAMWPEGSNPEFFPEVKAIDKALALAGEVA